MSGIIYGLIDSETLELRYVGQTTKLLDVRLRRHKNRRDNPHLRNWLDKCPVSIITLERDPADINEAERRWIREMREQGARLINMTDGGEGGLGHKHTPETRAKMRAAKLGNQYALGYQHTSEARAKQSATLQGHKRNTPEARARMSVAKLGRKLTPEHCAKLSIARLGNQNSLGCIPWNKGLRNK